MIIVSLSVIGLICLGIQIYNFLSGRCFFLDRIDRYKLSKITLQNACQKWKNNTSRSDIIVCLSTIPSRIHLITPTLISILMQSKAPQTIRLHIPYHSKREQTNYQIPKELIDIPSLTIIRCDDYGPATKFIPAINEYNDHQPLLILDDDYLYPANLVDRYSKTNITHPDIIISASGWIVPTDLTDRPSTLWSNIFSIPPKAILCPRVKKPTEIDIIEGYSGYLVQPRFFDKHTLKDYSNVPECLFFVDDIWISAHAKVSKWVFPEKRFCIDRKNANKLFNPSSLGKQFHNTTAAIRYFKNRWLFNQKTPLQKTPTYAR